MFVGGGGDNYHPSLTFCLAFYGGGKYHPSLAVCFALNAPSEYEIGGGGAVYALFLF
jgi:hypothetical protein